MLVFGVLLELAPTALTVNQSTYVCLGRHRVRRSLPRLGSRPGLLVECSDHSHYTKQSCFLAGRPHLLRVIEVTNITGIGIFRTGSLRAKRANSTPSEISTLTLRPNSSRPDARRDSRLRAMAPDSVANRMTPFARPDYAR